MCFCCTQSDILLCGITKFSRGNNNISASKMKTNKNSQPQIKFTGSYKNKEITKEKRGFLGKGVLKICSKFSGEHPWQSGISIKLQSNLFFNFFV